MTPVKGKVKEMIGNTMVLDNGQSYRIGKNDLAPNVGDEVDGTLSPWTTPQGEIINYFRTKKQGFSGGGRREPYKEDPERQKKIIRQNVLGHAVQVVLGMNDLTKMPQFKAVEEIKKLAENLEEWVNR